MSFLGLRPKNSIFITLIDFILYIITNRENNEGQRPSLFSTPDANLRACGPQIS